MGLLKPHPALARMAARPAGAPLPLQHLLVALLRERWRSLALIPSHRQGDARPLAHALASLGGAQLGGSLAFLDAADADLPQVAELALELSAAAEHGRVLLTLRSVVDSAAALALAEKAEAVLLCVQMGEADVADARRTRALLSHARVIGCAAVYPGGGR